MLEKILEELRYQTKLMESMFEKKDEHRAGAEMMKKQLGLMKKTIMSTPGINPEMAKMLSSIFNNMPGGEPE